jgi:hypothetical protein
VRNTIVDSERPLAFCRKRKETINRTRNFAWRKAAQHLQILNCDAPASKSVTQRSPFLSHKASAQGLWTPISPVGYIWDSTLCCCIDFCTSHRRLLPTKSHPSFVTRTPPVEFSTIFGQRLPSLVTTTPEKKRDASPSR